MSYDAGIVIASLYDSPIAVFGCCSLVQRLRALVMREVDFAKQKTEEEKQKKSLHQSKIKDFCQPPR